VGRYREDETDEIFAATGNMKARRCNSDGGENKVSYALLQPWGGENIGRELITG